MTMPEEHVITVSEQATRAIRERCAAAGASPSVRVHVLGSGQPLAVTLVHDTTHRPGDQLAAADGVVVRVGRELAGAVDRHRLEAWPGEDPDSLHFVFTDP